MADDQVKYSDLIADDVVKGFELLNQVMKDLQSTMASLKTEATNAGSVIKNMGSANRDQQQEIARLAAEIDHLKKQLKGLSDEEKKVTEIKRQYKKLTDDQIARVDKLASALGGLRTADEAQRKHALARINLINVENMSYNEMQATYNALKDSLNAMTVAERQNTEAGKAMTVQSAKIYDTMNELQKATGKYTLQVGKYRAAFDGLGYSFQQILREAPSALNLNQFFLAISNNIPMFLDQLKSYKAEQAEIKANLDQMTKGTKEYAEQLDKVESVGKKLGRTLMSWQTLVLVGLMILRNWDRIVSGITSLFSNLTKEQKMLKAVNEEAASSIGDMTAKYVALQKEWQNLKAEDQGEWLKQHKDDWNELGISIDNVTDAENLYVKNTSIIQNAIDARARSIAAMKLAADKYEEAFKKQMQAEQDLKNRKSSFGSQVARGLAGAGMAEGTGYLTPEQMAFQQRSEEQAIQSYYDNAMKEVKKLQDEAQYYITNWVLPGQTGGSTTTTPKTPKSSEPIEQTTVNKYWEAERALLEAQKQGYELERALAQLNRDKQLKEINNWYVDQRQALQYNLEHNFITQEQYDANIIELDRQNKALQIGITNQYNAEIAKINKKQADEELKAKKAQEEAAEKAAKDGAKAELKAAVDGWAQYKAKMVEEGKTRKQIVEAEVAAEIARLNLMLKLNRDINGEKMSDEQRQKVEEWINLLKRLQKTGNYGDYKPGQFMGKGGANVTNDKKNWSNIAEVMRGVLDVNITNEQISALNSVFDHAKEALNSWMDARKAAADQAKELADDEVSAAENALNREIELRNQGYANNVALREKELADAKEKQKQAVEEQKKIVQQQILLDAALQTSSLITATANIIKQFPNPLVWGPMLATMWGSFAFAKIKAYQASTKSIKFREGGVMLLEGGSHESGHDVNLGIGPDGSNLRAEGGEYFAVINKRNSRKYGSEIPAVVNALNSGMFEDRYIKTSDAIGNLGGLGIVGNVGERVDLSAVESGVGQLVKQGESQWTVEGEYRVERYKNRVRRVRIG